jgi:hypothetical protein
MPKRLRPLILSVLALLGAPAGLASAQEPVAPLAEPLRAEWTVETARPGRAQVVGYLHNRGTKEAVNVWVRVDRLGADGAVAGSYRRLVMGDVPSGGRALFQVPVGEADARYRVTVEAVDWTDPQCR